MQDLQATRGEPSPMAALAFLGSAKEHAALELSFPSMLMDQYEARPLNLHNERPAPGKIKCIRMSDLGM